MCLPRLYWRYVCKKRAESLDVPRGYEDWEEGIVGTYEGYDEPCLDLVGDTVWQAEIPAEHPWQVFAYIPTRLGDAEDCLHATEHMAIAKHWYENYGAEILRLNSEQISLHTRN